MAGKKFSWGRKHTIISAIAVVVIGAIAWIYLATASSPVKSQASQQAACQSFAAIVKDASSKPSLKEGVGLLIKGADGASKIADPNKELSRQLAKLGAVKVDQIDLESADTAAAIGARIQIINDLCTAEFASAK